MSRTGFALVILLLTLLVAPATQAQTLRIATFHTELERDGPGLLYRDILSGPTADVKAVIATIGAAAPDILLLQGFDHDSESRALTALRDRLMIEGIDYPFQFAPTSNRGRLDGVDLNGDGRISLPDDAQGYGEFRGQGAMALLSRFPLDATDAHDFSGLLWADLPDARTPLNADGTPYPSLPASKARRLSTTGHWVVPVQTPQGRLDILAFHATPPVFDGPEDFNGLRNADEITFWLHYLDGRLGPVSDTPFVILGIANLDPQLGEGDRDALSKLLSDPRVIDPAPRGTKGRATVEWANVSPPRQRVDYALPASSLTVRGSGIVWPPGPDAGRHGLVWVDVELPDTAATAAANATAGGVD